MFVEEDDDKYIDSSEISDELYRSVDAFSSDEGEEYNEFENQSDAGEYYRKLIQKDAARNHANSQTSVIPEEDEPPSSDRSESYDTNANYAERASINAVPEIKVEQAYDGKAVR